MKTTVRRRIAVAALIIAAPAATACSQGFDAQTDQQYQTVAGVTAHLEAVDLIAAAVVAGDDQRGTLAASVVADEETTLTDITGEGVTVKGLPVEIPADTPVNLAAEEGIEIAGSDVEPGGYVTLTFTFANGETTELTVPVVEASGDYADVELPEGSTSSDDEASSEDDAAGTHEEGTEGSEDAAH